ncbi:hypothetical protein MASR1M32_02030 [Rhodobacter sp.]
MIQKTDRDLTVVIPTKDRPQLLAAAVASALATIPEGAEVLVVDDRSGTPVTGALLSITDARLRIIPSEAAPGASGTRNWGVAQARGTRILFLDDDDLLIPGYPAWLLEQRHDYGFAPIQRFQGLAARAAAPFPGGTGRAIADVRPFRRQIAGLGCGFWIDRDAFLSLGGLAEDIRVNEDTEFSIRLLRAGLHGLRAPAAAVMVRQHGDWAEERGHLTASAKAGERAARFGLILSRHEDWLLTRPDAAKHLLQRQLKLLAQAGDRAGARAVLASRLARPHRLSLWLYHRGEQLSARLRGR